MNMPRGNLELTWAGDDGRTRLEPRVPVEDPTKSFGDLLHAEIRKFGLKYKDAEDTR